MPDSSTSASPTPESLVFAAYHQPPLTSGNYKIRVEHTFHTSDNSTIPLQPPFTAERSFRVEGERFQLKPDEIQAVFPPQGSLGDHSNVLPHIILTHSTLPWDRRPDGSSPDDSSDPLPWLLLLVFSEAEKPETKTVTLADLGPDVALNAHQKASDPVSVIDVPRQVLEPLLPSLDDLKMLAHVRRLDFGTDIKMSRDDLDESERAVILANRLPEAGATTTVHLVSIEGCYETNGQFNFGSNDNIRLVSLTSWRFSCISSEHTFANMIKGLEHDNSSFRLPISSNADAETFLQEGFIPVRHALRQGGKTLSWYRGPFVTGAINETPTLPVHTSDALLRYHSDVGMFDVSYSSAWELGRLMALQSPTFSSNLYEWKRLRDQEHKSNNRPEQDNHPLAITAVETEMPESVKTWLEQLSYLQGVPFKYLVPDERLLPKESVRFFQVDVNWIRCLLDGAYSIGRITQADFECDQLTQLSIPYTHATGILIRSDIISGYPGLLIDAYSDRNGKTHLTELRRQYLSPNILLCIFKGDLVRLDIHQKPEMLHFAVESSSPGVFKKPLRKVANTKDDFSSFQGSLEIETNRKVPISKLAHYIRQAYIDVNQFNSGSFALQMLETAEKVSFYRSFVTLDKIK
jgi:hypothetical protein